MVLRLINTFSIIDDRLAHIKNNDRFDDLQLSGFDFDLEFKALCTGGAIYNFTFTLVGFLMVLGQAFADIDTSSTESMTAAIGTLATGMSTALVTSLVGLVTSIWLKYQLVILEDGDA